MFKLLCRGFIIGCFAAFISWSFFHMQILNEAEKRTYDVRQYLTMDENMSGIIIVGIDDPSISELGRWPWQREVYAKALENILAAKPGVVGIDVFFTEESSEPKKDQTLKEVINGKNVVLAGYVSSENTDRDSTEPYYIKPLGIFTNPNGHVNVYPDKDGILRKSIADIKIEGMNLASFDMQILEQCNIDISITDRISENGEFLFKYSNEPNTTQQISFLNIYNNQFDPADIADKIVLIGGTTVGIQDQYFTPVGGPMYGVEYHAQVINALINEKVLIHSPLSGIVIVSFGVIAGILFSICGWLTGLLLNILIVLSYLFFNVYQFDIALTILPVLYPLLAVFLTYLFNSGFKIWEAQREKRKLFRLFSRYVSHEVAKKLANGRPELELGGSRREITVLFLDIRNFTSMSEEKSPEEVVNLLNSLFNIITRIIFEFGGTLDKYIGDAVMAVFNAPQEILNHEYQAVKASIEIQRKIEERGEEYIKEYGVEIGVGIGINSGEAIVGNIGTEERADYTAIGDIVNIAARLEAKAEKGEILIGNATKEKISDLNMFCDKGLIFLEGKKEPIEVYTVKWK